MTRSEDERNNMKKQKVAVYVASMLVLGSHAVGYAEGDSHFVESGQVTGEKSVAIVSTSSVNGESAVAIGDASNVEANHAVAIGKDSKASGESSVAIGNQSESLGTNSLAIGKETKATVDGGVAIGVNSIADRSGKTARYIGYNPMSNTNYKVGEAGADNPKLEALYENIRQANYEV